MFSPLFVVSAAVEVITGLALAFRPATTLWLFFGSETVSVESLAISRLCGAALVAIAVSCWCARGEPAGRASRGILWGMLVYNPGAFAVLGLTAIAGQSGRLALWPGVLVHYVFSPGLSGTKRRLFRRKALSHP